MENNKRSLWMGIGEKIFYVFIVIVTAAYFSGGARQKIQALGKDMDEWKAEWKERDRHITKMDLEGSVATKNFVVQYEKEQLKQYERIKHLEDEVAHLDSMELRIERLEKNHIKQGP